VSRAPLPAPDTFRAFLSGGVAGAICGLFWREVFEGLTALARAFL
jgi:hypothetical protein